MLTPQQEQTGDTPDTRGSVLDNSLAPGASQDAPLEAAGMNGAGKSAPGDNEPSDNDVSMSFARLLSWVMLLLIVASTSLLTVFIANSARGTLLKKAEDFSLLMAENLNHQIYTRFVIPTLMGSSYVALRRPDHYERLDQVVQSTIHGLHVDELRIYGEDRIVSYSSNSDDLGISDMAGPAVDHAIAERGTSVEMVSEFSLWQAMFRPSLPVNSFRLRTTAPLLTERSPLGSDGDEYLLGVLEMTQDITQDMRDLVRFVWLSVAASLFSAIILFILLQSFIRKAERALTMRMRESQRLERELHQHEKLASMGRVVASIAHEVRNPLGIIRSSAELLISRYKDSDKVLSGLLEAIHDEARRLSRTVTDFLDYARPRKPKDDPVSVNLLLEQAHSFLGHAFEQNKVDVRFDVEPGLTTLGDKELLYRALYNVLVNAAQAMEDRPAPRLLRVTAARRKDGRLEITVRDNGPGFDPERLVHATDPFYTTKEGGTGLGLAIVNSIITSHSGALFLENAPPADAPPADAPPADAPPADAPPAGTALPATAEKSGVQNVQGAPGHMPESAHAPGTALSGGAVVRIELPGI